MRQEGETQVCPHYTGLICFIQFHRAVNKIGPLTISMFLRPPPGASMRQLFPSRPPFPSLGVRGLLGYQTKRGIRDAEGHVRRGFGFHNKQM